MGSREIDSEAAFSAEVQSGSGENPESAKGHDDSIIVVASYVYEVLGLWRE